MSIKQLSIIAVAVTLACTPAAGTSEMGNAPTPRKTSILTAEEIVEAKADHATAFDALVRLRPMWLAKRGPASFQGADTPTLFIDGQLVADFNTLRNIAANDIADIRYYRPDQAGGEFGLRAGSVGAIEVRLKVATHPPVP